jgi:hypothetical protein
MSYLINEILLRLAKIVGAGIIGALIYVLAVGFGGAQGSFELGVLCYVAAAVSILLLESSPI